MFMPVHTRVYLALGYTDMRKSINGLSFLVENQLEVNWVEQRAGYCVFRPGLSVSAPFVWRCLNNLSMATLASPPSSNRACDFPAHGFSMFFTVNHALLSSQLSSAPCKTHTSARAIHSGSD
jgi:hypothetical protein